MPRKLKYTDEQLAVAVPKAVSYTGVCRLLGITPYGGNGNNVKRRIDNLGLSVAHFSGQAWNKGIKRPSNIKDIDKLLCENSPVKSQGNLKRRLLLHKLLIPICAVCGCGEQWNGHALVLHLDHINGIKTDNRLSNLRMLCPNCHSQTHTFAGRNKPYLAYTPVVPMVSLPCAKGVKKVKSPPVCACGSLMGKSSIRCSKCSALYRQKISWPSDEDLKALVWSKPTVHAAKILGVSDKAIDKRCKKRGIVKPARGYWEKIYHNNPPVAQLVEACGLEPQG